MSQKKVTIWSRNEIRLRYQTKSIFHLFIPRPHRACFRLLSEENRSSERFISYLPILIFKIPLSLSWRVISCTVNVKRAAWLFECFLHGDSDEGLSPMLCQCHMLCKIHMELAWIIKIYICTSTSSLKFSLRQKFKIVQAQAKY